MRSPHSAPPGGTGGRRASAAADAARRLAESRAEEDLLRHHQAELDALAPEGDEEERLGARRTLLQNAERLGEAVAEAIAEIDGEGGAQQALARALRRLDRARDRAQGLLDAALAAAERAATETGEALAALSRRGAGARARSARARRGRGAAVRVARVGPQARCRGRRSAARCAPSSASGSRRSRPAPTSVAALERGSRGARGRITLPRPQAVSQARERAAHRLDMAVAAELKPLRLDKARFRTRADPARRGRMGRAWQRARAFRGRDQPRRAVRRLGADRLGRRIVALHAGAEAGACPAAPRCRR